MLRCTSLLLANVFTANQIEKQAHSMSCLCAIDVIRCFMSILARTWHLPIYSFPACQIITLLFQSAYCRNISVYHPP